MNTIVLNNGEELRPEEAIVHLLQQVSDLQTQVSDLKLENNILHQRLGAIETVL